MTNTHKREEILAFWMYVHSPTFSLAGPELWWYSALAETSAPSTAQVPLLLLYNMAVWCFYSRVMDCGEPSSLCTKSSSFVSGELTDVLLVVVPVSACRWSASCWWMSVATSWVFTWIAVSYNTDHSIVYYCAKNQRIQSVIQQAHAVNIDLQGESVREEWEMAIKPAIFM